VVRLIDPLATTLAGPSSEATSERLTRFWHPADAEEAATLGNIPSAEEVLETAREAEPALAAKETADPFNREADLMADFRNFLCVVWEFLGLPAPSAVQLSLAWWLQHGPDRAVILGFRGMAKSWITGAFILWSLYNDPQKKVLVLSASLDRSVQMVQWCLALIREMPELQFLVPGPLQRASGRQFDVGPSRPDQSPSLRGAGITGQITGSRAHLIVPDDVEIPNNSMTTLMREKISETVKELDAIIHPGGKIKFLGTPQVDDSLYVKLLKRGYQCRIWPARFPNKKMQVKYGDRLAPWITSQIEMDPTRVGHSVWPGRFTDADLDSRELSYGRSGFALQFMLDTSLSDADRYPLKLRDLIVYHLDPTLAPDVIAWGNDPKLIQNDLPVMGFEGDRYYGPASTSETVSRYNSVVAWIDPSGRGADETAISIVGELHGRLFLLYCIGFRDGYSPTSLQALATVLVQYNVNKAWVEDNFGDGMFTALLSPYVIKAWAARNAKLPGNQHGGTGVEGIRSPKVQKELRVLGVLEPATQQHRLVVSASVVEQDFASVQAYGDAVGQDNLHHYSLFHQFSHISRERDCLLHDDRLETVAGAVSTFSALLGIDPWTSAADLDEQRMADELEALLAECDEISDDHRGTPRWNRAVSAVRPN
jgi:hypothetical protein